MPCELVVMQHLHALSRGGRAAGSAVAGLKWLFKYGFRTMGRCDDAQVLLVFPKVTGECLGVPG